jgi:hypothetical protein
MSLTAFAMRRPVTTLMLVVALISGGALAYSRMRVGACAGGAGEARGESGAGDPGKGHDG